MPKCRALVGKARRQLLVRLRVDFAADPEVLARVEHLSCGDAVRLEVPRIHLRYAVVDRMPGPYRLLSECGRLIAIEVDPVSWTVVDWNFKLMTLNQFLDQRRLWKIS